VRGLVLTISLLIAGLSHAECNFRTASYLTSMNSPEFIKSISIEVPNSSKFARNQFKILTSKSENIPNKLKKSFKAKVIVNYDFGFCEYSGKIRQSGDWKDHINFLEGNPVQSLDVKLEDGNVVGATRFKLLIPETRNGRNEVLGALLLRELGFIAPETFEINVSVNGLRSLMLFQEKSEKELLERNLRREGPIFEGDESLLWSYQNFSNFELERLALSRLVNDNWFMKGYTSQIIVVNSFNRLQKAYFDFVYSSHLGKNSIFMQANSKNDYFFNDYHWLLLAMGGQHALKPHNRKFYFNAIEDRFEPIYYDGNLSFTDFAFREDQGYEYVFKASASADLLERVEKILSSEIVKQNYLKRIRTTSTNDAFYNSSIAQIISNLEFFASIPISNTKWDSFGRDTELSWYQSFQKEKNLSQKIVQRVALQKNSADLYGTESVVETVSVSDLSKILSKNELNGERYVIIPQGNSFDEISEYKEFNIGRNLVRTSDGIEIVLDEKNKKIDLIQQNASGWALFLGGDYSNWDINFKGSRNNAPTSSTDQRFNKFGLTGCLTLYQTIINDTRLKVSDGQCEDSLNLLRVKGSNVRILINNAFADALDVDFSKLDIASLEIKNAGNDCFDVSGGIYSTWDAMLENCSDKAISIGEMSAYQGEVVHIDGANIGISSKDFSQVRVKILNATNVSYCGEAMQKKQEFGGGDLMIEKVNCAGSFSKDEQSLIQIVDL